MYTFLKIFAGSVLALMLFLIVGGAMVPERTPAQRFTDDKLLCENQAHIRLDTLAAHLDSLPSAAREAEAMASIPKLGAYARCMVGMGYSLPR